MQQKAHNQRPEERIRLRQAEAKPTLDDLEAWLQAQLAKISGKSELAKAIRYALSRMKKLRPYLDHGVLEQRARLEPDLRSVLSDSHVQVSAGRQTEPGLRFERLLPV